MTRPLGQSFSTYVSTAATPLILYLSFIRFNKFYPNPGAKEVFHTGVFYSLEIQRGLGYVSENYLCSS